MNHDPALNDFLDTIEDSIGLAQDIPEDLILAMKALTAGIDFDPDDEIEGDVVIG